MTSKILRAVIMGAPASGKGTISSRIVNKFGLEHISAGDILRLNIKNGTPLGQTAKKYIEGGLLVPDDLVIKCIFGRIIEIGKKSWLLDGFPRTVVQAEELNAQHPVDVVVNLQVPKQVIVERTQGRWTHLPSGRVYNIGFNEPKVPFKDDVTGEPLVQRDDDKPETVAKRFELYESCTKPVIEYYKNLNICYDFAGKATNEIWPRVDEFLMEKTKSLMANRQ